MEGELPGFVHRKPTPAPRDSPLTRLNTAVAWPLASFFRALGFAPGQLSVQSLTVTVLGIVQMADGSWPRVVSGVAIVYVGLLLDRADSVLAQRSGKQSPWTSYLGLAIDRLVDLALLVGLGILAVRGITSSPIPAWTGIDAATTAVLAAAAAGLLLLDKALGAASDLHVLRHHLLTSRRLPGPSAIPRARPARAILQPVFGRDETILLWCAGVGLGQVALTALVFVALHAALVVERLVLFRLRLRDPEVDASRVLAEA